MTGRGLRTARALGRPMFAIPLGMLRAVFRVGTTLPFLGSEAEPAASGSAAHCRRSETAAAEAAAKTGTAKAAAAEAAAAEAAAAEATAAEATAAEAAAAKSRAGPFFAASIALLRRPIGLAAGFSLLAFAVRPPRPSPSSPGTAPAGKAELRSAAFGRPRCIGAIGVFRPFFIISPR